MIFQRTFVVGGLALLTVFLFIQGHVRSVRCLPKRRVRADPGGSTENPTGETQYWNVSGRNGSPWLVMGDGGDTTTAAGLLAPVASKNGDRTGRHFEKTSRS